MLHPGEPNTGEPSATSASQRETSALEFSGERDCGGPSCPASGDGAAKVASHCASSQCSAARAFICSSEPLSIDLAPVAHSCLNNSGLYELFFPLFALCAEEK